MENTPEIKQVTRYEVDNMLFKLLRGARIRALTFRLTTFLASNELYSEPSISAEILILWMLKNADLIKDILNDEKGEPKTNDQ